MTSVGVQGLLFITGVIAARLLGPSDRGYLALILTVATTISQFGSLGLPLAVTFELSAGRTTIGALVRSIGPPVARQIAAVTAGQAVAMVVLLQVSSVPTAAAWVSVAVVPLTLIQTFAVAAIQGTQRFGAMNVVRILPLGVYAIGLPALAIAGDVTLLSTTIVWVTAYGAGAIAGVVACRSARDAPAPDGSAQDPAAADGPARGAAADTPAGDQSNVEPDLRAMRRFGLRGFLGWVSPTDTLRVDQLVVGLVLPARALGLYVAALAFTNLPRFLAQGIGLVAYPAVARAPDGPERRRAMIVYTAFGSGLSVMTCGVLALLSDPLVRIAFGDEFGAASGPLRVLLGATALLCIRRVVSDVLRGAGQEQRGSQAEAVSWIVLIPGLVLLADPYGLYGVAVTLAITYAVALAVIVVLAARSGWSESPPAAPPGGPDPADLSPPAR